MKLRIINISIVIIVLSCALALYLQVRRTQTQVDTLRKSLAAAQQEIDTTRIQIDALKDNIARRERSETVYIERSEMARGDYEHKMHDIQTNSDACDWLDDALPYFVRQQFSCYDLRTAGTDDPTCGTVETVHQTDAGNDEYKP